jgi:hypothetical protein
VVRLLRTESTSPASASKCGHTLCTASSGDTRLNDYSTAHRFAHSPNLGVRRAAKERARRDNYWLRPAAPKLGEPHLFVDIRFVLFKLTNVDTVAGSAFVKVSLIAYWTDPRVKGWVGPLPEQLWGPAFNLTNGLGDLTVTQDEFELLDKSTGRLKRTFVYEGTIDNPMDLRAFPCDFDDLPMTFTTMSRWMCNDGSASGKVRTLLASLSPSVRETS